MEPDQPPAQPASEQAGRGPELLVLGSCRLVGTGVDQSGLTQVQRRLLARLALSAPMPVRLMDLAEAIWEGEPPRHLRAAIHNQVSRVRAAHGDGVVRTTPEGYTLGLRTDADRLRDLSARAELLLEQGEPAAARELADAAVPLWTGTPYADLDHVDGVHAARRVLTASRRAAENTRLAAALALGRSGWALPEAEQLAGDSPLDERRQAMLARALALAGHRGDALATIAAARRRLRTELGIDAGVLLRAAEEEILHPVEHFRPDWPAPIELVGREGEVRAVLGGVARGAVVEVLGERGAGVTRVLGVAGAHLRHLGIRAINVSTLDHQDSAVALLRSVLDELGAEVGSRGVVAGFADSVAAETARSPVPTPVAVLVDDAHALGPTARRVLLDAANREHVQLVLGGHGEPSGEGHEVVGLGPLGREAVARLALLRVEQALDAAELDRLVADSGGNPLVLEILLAGLGQGAPGGSSAHTAVRISGVVQTLMAGMGGHERAFIERAAVGGDGFPVEALPHGGPLSGHLISVRADGSVQFRHGAVRDALYHDIAPARRDELHIELGRAALEAGAPPALVARHLLAAGALAADEAVEACRGAAAEAGRQGAPADASRWLRSAAAVEGLDPRVRLAVQVELGDAQRLAGEPEHVGTLTEALRTALEVDDEALVADACFALLELGGTTVSGALPDGMPELVEHALLRVRSPARRSRISAAASLAWSLTGRAERSRAFFDDAEALADTDVDRAAVLPFAYMALGMPADLPRRRDLARELLEIGERLQDPAAAFEAWQLDFSVRLQEGDGEGARHAVAQMAGLTQAVGDVGRRWAHQFAAAATAHLDGDDVAAERLADEACALFEPVSPSRAFAAHAGQLFALRLAQGRLAELADTLAWLVEDQPGLPAWHAAYALAEVAAGADATKVARHADRALELAQEDVTWLAAHVVGARAVAAIGHVDLARSHLTRLTAWSGRAVWQGTCCYGPVDTALALLHRALGDEPAAQRHAGLARGVVTRLAAVPFADELDRLGLCGG